MPGPGVSILWNESSPAESDIADAAPIRSIETSIRNAMAVEHNFPSTGGANVGYHLLGSARVHYDVESNVSSSGTDGRILVTSDTSRLFHVGSAGTMFLGGQNVLSLGSQPQGGQRFYWAIETGETAHGNTVSFPNSGFSGVPFMFGSCVSNSLVANSAFVQFATISPTQFLPFAVDHNGAASANSIRWFSIGTRVF